MPTRWLWAAVMGLGGVAAMAGDGPEKEWSYKDWRVELKGGRCALSTGGDGDGFFRLEFGMLGFDAAAIYQPLWYRSEPMPLEFEDGVAVVIDGRDSGFGDEMAVFDGRDEWDDYFRAAALTTGYVPDLVETLRRANRIAFVVFRPGRAPAVYDDLSLSGFTAVYLKASEWCRFSPTALPRA